MKDTFLLFTTEGSLVNITDSQALHLSNSVTYCHNTGKDPLAVVNLDNQLCMLTLENIGPQCWEKVF